MLVAVQYELVVRGEIGDRFAALFGGMRLRRDHGRTVLTGDVVDQAHLQSLIARVADLGLELVSLNPRYDSEGARDRRPHRH